MSYNYLQLTLSSECVLSKKVNFEVGVRPVAEFFKQISSRQIFPQSINGGVLVEIIVRSEIDFSLVLKSCQARVKNRLPCQLPQHRTHQARFDSGSGSKPKLLPKQFKFTWCCFALHILRLWSKLFLFFYILQHMAKESPVLVVRVAISLPFEVIKFT